MAPLSIALANDNWTLSLSCDAYNRGETDALLAPLASEAWVSNEILTALTAYSTTVQVGTAISDALGAYSSTAEMNTAISDAIDALNVAQYQDAAGVQFLIDQALLAYWTQAEVSSFVAGELANYATSASVSSSISSALSSYDDSGQVDSKIVTALLDFYTRAEIDQAIADATSGSVDLSNYYTSAETQSYVANELLAYYPRTELDSLLTATLIQYWTSGRTQTEIDDALRRGLSDPSGRGPTLLRARSRRRVRADLQSSSRTIYTPNRAQLALGSAPDGRRESGGISPPCASEATPGPRRRRTAASSGPTTSGPSTPDASRWLPAPREVASITSSKRSSHQNRPEPPVPNPLSAQPILGNGSTLQISCDCWSKGQSDTRYPLIANFNSLGQRVTDLENSPGVDPSADLTVNSLTATAFVQTPQLQSAAADLQIQNALVTVRREDGAPLASFADGGISLDLTVAAASTLNATTADFAQLLVGSTAASGTFNSSSSVTANLEVVRNLRVEAPLVRCDPAASVLTIQGGTNGVLVDDTLRINGALASEASLPFLSSRAGAAECRCSRRCWSRSPWGSRAAPWAR